MHNVIRILGVLSGAKPWLPENAIGALEALIEPSHRVFELGGGGSTVFFARRAAEVFTLELDPYWYFALASFLSGEGHGDKCEVVLLANSKLYGPAGLVKAVVESLKDNYYDWFFIDSYCKREAVIAGGAKIKPGGYMVIDNYGAGGLADLVKLRYGWPGFSIDPPSWSGTGTFFLRKPLEE